MFVPIIRSRIHYSRNAGYSVWRPPLKQNRLTSNPSPLFLPFHRLRCALTLTLTLLCFHPTLHFSANGEEVKEDKAVSGFAVNFSELGRKFELNPGSIQSAIARACAEVGAALLCTALYAVLYCTVRCTVLHSTLLHCTVLYCTVLHCTALCCTALHCTVLHCTVLHCTILHYTALYCTVLYCTALYTLPPSSQYLPPHLLSPHILSPHPFTSPHRHWCYLL